MKRIPIAEIRRKNKEAGHFFFSKDTTKFFHSRYPRNGWLGLDGKTYLIIADQRESYTPVVYRLWAQSPNGDMGVALGTFDTEHEAMVELTRRAEASFDTKFY